MGMKEPRVPFHVRWHTIRWRWQIAMYRWYRRASGRRWEYPRIGGGTRFRVTKSIPGIGIRIIERTLWLTVPMVIDREELADSSET